MNSERIKARFGSYHVQVLHQDALTRLASLCSRHDAVDICRTLAVTRFANPTPAALAEADALIRKGDSIGSTLAQAGQHLSREIIAEASVPCGDAFLALAGHTVKRGDLLSVRLYRLDAGPDPEALMPYATIAEAHILNMSLSPIRQYSSQVWLEETGVRTRGLHWKRFSPHCNKSPRQSASMTPIGQLIVGQ
mgnify:CR=1 FL=1